VGSASGAAWLFSRPADLLLLGVPIWVTWLVCFSLPNEVLARQLPLWVWAVVIVGIDVSHVWSTLFRTYLDPQEFRRHRLLLLRAPLVAFTIFFCLAGLSTLWFWRVMAYLALFHFVRQQFGFFALYAARFRRRQRHLLVGDSGIIYLATLYPVAHWHLSGERNFAWFVDDDFLTASALPLEPLLTIANAAYWILIGFWCWEEIRGCRRQHLPLPTGKLLWLLTTAGTWYLGIVHFNSDIAFTMTNVVAHGLPYITLVAYYDRQKNMKRTGIAAGDDVAVASSTHLWSRVSFMVGVILLLAFGEEYLWDMLLFREKAVLFAAAFAYPVEVLSTPAAQALALALLALPQVTHYIVDGFIWKNDERNPEMRALLA